MKTLYLIRHAQATARDDQQPDLDRVLDARGFKQAKRTAGNLRQVTGRPDLMVSSPARRALETAQVFAESLDYPVQRIRLDQTFYDAPDAPTLAAVISQFPDQVESVMVFGHEPLLSDTVGLLIPGCRLALAKAAVAGVSFDGTSWADALMQGGVLEYHDSPLSRSERVNLARQVRKALSVRIESRLGELLETEAHMHTRALQKRFRAASRDLAATIMELAESRGLLQRQWARRIMEAQEEKRST
jgi:phosphohistidine phosphatase